MISFDSTSDTTVDEKQQSTKTLFLLEQFGQSTFVSKMNVSVNGDVGESKVIDPAEFIEKLQESNSISRYASNELIDERILVKSTKKLVWYYQPKQEQRLFYRQSGRTINAKINWCTLVFMRVGDRLSVCAIQHNKRPNASTRVYHVPLPNVYVSSSICLGSCVLPKTNDIDKISETYLDSTKTHLNNNSMFRSQKKPVTDKMFFEYISKKKNEKIKVSELSVFGTLSDFINSARG